MANGSAPWRQRVLQAIPSFPGEAQDESSWTPGYIRLASCGYSLLQALPHLDTVSGFTANDRPDPRPILPMLFEKVTSGSELTAEERRAYAFWAAGHFLNAAQSRIAAALDAIVNNLMLRLLPNASDEIVDNLLHLYPSTRVHILLATWSVDEPLARKLELLREAFGSFAPSYREVDHHVANCRFSDLTLDVADKWDGETRTRLPELKDDWQAVVLCWSRCNMWKHLPDSSHEARLRLSEVHFVDWIWSYRGLCTLSDFWKSDAEGMRKGGG